MMIAAKSNPANVSFFIMKIFYKTFAAAKVQHNLSIYLDVGVDVLGTPDGVVEDEGDADDGDDIAD